MSIEETSAVTRRNIKNEHPPTDNGSYEPSDNYIQIKGANAKDTHRKTHNDSECS